MPEGTPPKPVEQMSASEIAAALGGLTRLQLTAILIQLSAYAPKEFAEAFRRYSTEATRGDEH